MRRGETREFDRLVTVRLGVAEALGAPFQRPGFVMWVMLIIFNFTKMFCASLYFVTFWLSWKLNS